VTPECSRARAVLSHSVREGDLIRPGNCRSPRSLAGARVSVERRRRRDGRLSYRVRFRQGGKNRARTFDQLRDAYRFESEVRRRKQLGDLDMLNAGQQTLNDLAEDWWKLHAEPNLAAKTREIYRGVWERHLSPRLGDLKLVEITTAVVEGFVLDLRAAGVGEVTIQKAVVVLQGMMKKAVVWGRLTSNPVAGISKRRQERASSARALSPHQVEAIRGNLEVRDATLVSLLAYAGLRPGEALALRWGDIRERTILVERAVSLGEVKATKTRRARTVEMLSSVVADLARWKLASGRPDDADLLFPRKKDGKPWTEGDWKNWRRKVFRPAAESAGLAGIRPYDLRHSFCSLLLEEGRSVVYVARQAGHSPTMTLSTYAHVIDELPVGETMNAEDAIHTARAHARIPLATRAAQG
jgi:integrase